MTHNLFNMKQGSTATTTTATPPAPSASTSTVTARSVVVKTEFRQDDKVYIPIGEKKNIFIAPTIFREEVRVNIREFFTAPEDNSEDEDAAPRFIPTKRGVSLTVQEFETLCEKIERTKTLVKRLGKRLRKQH